MEETTAESMWEKLEKLYMGKDSLQRAFLKRSVYNLRMEEWDIMEHLNVFNHCINNLLQVEVKYEEKDKALLLLRSLSSSFMHFQTTLIFGKETLQFEEVVQDIISHVKMNKISGDDMKSAGQEIEWSSGLIQGERWQVWQLRKIKIPEL